MTIENGRQNMYDWHVSITAEPKCFWTNVLKAALGSCEGIVCHMQVVEENQIRNTWKCGFQLFHGATMLAKREVEFLLAWISWNFFFESNEFRLGAILPKQTKKHTWLFRLWLYYFISRLSWVYWVITLADWAKANWWH